MFGLPTVKHNVILPQLRDRGYVVSGARPLIVIMSVLLGYCGNKVFRTWPKNANADALLIIYCSTPLSSSVQIIYHAHSMYKNNVDCNVPGHGCVAGE